MVAGIVAICLIGMGGSGFFLFQLLQRTNPAVPDGESSSKTEVATKPTPEGPTAITRPEEPSKDHATTVETKVASVNPTTKGVPAPGGDTPKGGTSGGLPGTLAANITDNGAKKDDSKMKTAPVASGSAENPEPKTENRQHADASKEGSPKSTSKAQDKSILAQADDRAGTRNEGRGEAREKPESLLLPSR